MKRSLNKHKFKTTSTICNEEKNPSSIKADLGPAPPPKKKKKQQQQKSPQTFAKS